MAVQDWSATPDENTTIDGLDIAEHCPAKNINDAIRSVMASVKKNDASVVHTANAETIDGAKTFTQGPYGTTVTLTSGEVDVSKGSVFIYFPKADTTFSFVNAPEGKATVVTLIIFNGGAYQMTWPNGNVFWANQAFPALSAAFDVVNLLTPDGGVTWYGAVAIPAAHHVDLS